MTLVYLSGPMRGLPAHNYPQFDAAAADLRAAGHEVLSPAENFGGDVGRPVEEYLRKDLADVLAVDAVVVLPGWERSAGCRIELDVATAIGTPIYAYDQISPTSLLPPDLRSPASPAREGQGVRGIHAPQLDVAAARRASESVLQEAERIVSGDRGDAYGHPAQDFGRIASIWSVVLGIPVTARQVALCMIGLKMSRLIHNPSHRDSIVDIGGYAKCYDLVRQAEDAR